ncbi:MAG: hypothetical protein U0103_16210 [Candidatus Obscuribacterales bacterium]|nr:hypothetical protein [Cyanobacteria bacterium SZAS LIN-5]
MSAHHETHIYSQKAVESDRNSAKTAAQSNLHSEAVKHLSGPAAKHASDKHGSGSEKFMPTNGDYWVVRGDNLYKIAQRSLLAQGKDRPDGRSIFAEIDRIVELNLKYYPKLRDHRLEPGMILTVDDKKQPANAKPVTEATQPDARQSDSRQSDGRQSDARQSSKTQSDAATANNDPNSPCTEQVWKFAEPGTVTTAQKCDLVFAGADSKVVVHPGGQALLQKGASGFVFKGGQATVMEGATVIDAGGAIELKPGAKFVNIAALSRQANETQF